MATEQRSYEAFTTYPATGYLVGPTRRIDDLTRNARVLLSGDAFSVRVQISNAPVTGYEHMFTVPEASWETYATVAAADAPVDVQQPVKWLRLVVDSGNVTGGSIAESTAAEDPSNAEIQAALTAASSAQASVTALANSLTRVHVKTPGVLPTLTANTVYQLGAGTYQLAPQTLPDGVTLEGVPGQTVIQPTAAPLPITGINGRWMYIAAGTGATLRNIVLDTVDKADCHYAILCAGSLDFIGGGGKNMLGDTQGGAFFLTQIDPSTHFVVRGATFDNIRAYEDGAESNNVGAARAIYVCGLNWIVDGCTFNNIGGFEDGDPVHAFRAQDATDGWTSAGAAKCINNTFNGFGKRAIKIQASDVESYGNRMVNTETDLTKSPRCGIELFGSRNKAHDNTIILSRGVAGVILSNPAGHDNEVVNNFINNGVGTGYTAARQGSTLMGILEIATSTLISGNTIESSYTGVYLYAGSVGAKVLNNPLIAGAIAGILNDAASPDIIGNTISGPSAGGSVGIGIQYGAASTGANVRGNTYVNTTTAHRILTTATGHRIAAQNYRTGVTTQVNAAGNTGDNIIADAVGYQTPQTASMDLPSFELLNPTGQLNPHFDRDHSDALENIAHRQGNVPVVNITGIPGISAFTALGLTAHSGLQGGVSITFPTSTYPISAEVDMGAGSIATSYTTKFYPALLFQSVPTGLESVQVEVDTGSGYVLAYDQAVTPARHIRLPGITTGGNIKRIKYTLKGTTPASGTILWRRVLLLYPELGATQNKHPSWNDFRKAHQSDGSHASVTPTLDFPSIAAGATSAPLTVALGGLAVTDGFVVVPPANLPDGLVWKAYWSATSQLSIKLTNVTAAAIDPPSGGWVVKLVR